jgi:hypothetical protein
MLVNETQDEIETFFKLRLSFPEAKELLPIPSYVILPSQSKAKV